MVIETGLSRLTKWLCKTIVSTTLLLIAQGNTVSYAYHKVNSIVLTQPSHSLDGGQSITIASFEGPQGVTAADMLKYVVEDPERIDLMLKWYQKQDYESHTVYLDYDIEKRAQENLEKKKKEMLINVRPDWMRTDVFGAVTRSPLRVTHDRLGNPDSASFRVVQLSSIDTDFLISGVVDTFNTFTEPAQYFPTRHISVRVQISASRPEYNEVLWVLRSEYRVKVRIDAGLGDSVIVSTGIEACIQELGYWFVPYFSSYDVEFARINLRNHKRMADEAGALAAEKRYDEAYTKYMTIHREDPYGPEAIFNLGVLNEAVGNYASAVAYYDSAIAIDVESKTYAERRRMASGSLACILNLALSGFGPREMTWSCDASTSKGAITNDETYLVTRGDRNDRWEVFMEPERESAVSARVPGGVRLKVLENRGEWARVMLPDNSMGWLMRSDVSDR